MGNTDNVTVLDPAPGGYGSWMEFVMDTDMNRPWWEMYTQGLDHEPTEEDARNFLAWLENQQEYETKEENYE